jgi:hypothetical protein
MASLFISHVMSRSLNTLLCEPIFTHPVTFFVSSFFLSLFTTLYKLSRKDFTMASKSPLRKKRNFKNLTLEDSPVVLAAHSLSSSDSKTTPLSAVEAEYAALCEQLGDLEIGLELQLDLRPDDFKTLDELGRGNGGAVYKVLHERTSTIMARKVRWSSLLGWEKVGWIL